MKKRIIHLVSNKSWGGGEQYVFDLSRRLLEEDYDVRVVCRKIASVAEKFGRIVSVVYAPLCGYADVISLFRIGRLLTSRRSIVHVHNFRDAFTVIVARWLMRRRDIKIIVTRHLVRKAKTDWLHRFIYNNIDRIVFVSHLAKREFLSAGVKIDDSRISVIHNSIVLPQEQSTAFDIRGEYNIPSDCVMAMYHGRLASEKGVHRLFEAMKKLQNANLVLVVIGSGDEDYVAQLQAYVDENSLNDRIFMLGFRENVHGFLRQSDFGVVPSIVREAFSLSAIDYLAVAKPIVATDNGAQTEFLREGENALLVPPNDAEALAVAISEMVEKRQKREEMGKNGYRLYEEKFTYDIFFENITRIYNE